MQNLKTTQFKLTAILFFLSCFAHVLVAQTQTIRGRVLDDVSKNPIPGAAVIIAGSNPLIGTVSDIDGNFKLPQVPLGRVNLQVKFAGYAPLFIPEILVTSGKEVVLDLFISESVSTLKEVEITYDRKTDPKVTNNEFSTVSSRSFNPEETRKFAGSLGDPSRMASNFAGVIAGNDSRNDIVVRGNSPNAMLWQLEGLNIPNPNHFGGSYSTGGPVSILNANNLGKSDFFTSAFPAQYGNANGGVFDLQLREGNNSKHEFLAQIGFNGFELGAEGPFSKKSKASYLVSYRYSTLGLLKNVGVDPGTGAATPLYQDLNFKLNFPLKNNGKITVFGLGGFSSIDLLGADVDTTQTNYYGLRYEDLLPRYRTGIAGASWEQSLGTKTRIKTVIGASQIHENYTADSLDLANDKKYRRAQGDLTNNKYSFTFNLTHKINAKSSFILGLMHDYTQTDMLNRDFENKGVNEIVRVKIKGNLNLTQGFVQFKHRFTDKLTVNLGAHAQYFDLNKQAVVEPRAGIKYALNGKSSINAGYGLHNQTLTTYSLFAQNAAGEQSNRNLDFMQSQHAVLGYENMLTENLKLKVEAYYQDLSKIPVTKDSSSYSAINTGASFNPDDQADLVSKGTGKNYGLEFTLEQYYKKGFYFLSTVSLYESKYKAIDNIERNTAYNSRFAANLLAGKEFKFKKGGVLYFNIKATTIGGKYLTPVDLNASISNGREILDFSKPFSQQEKAYFRADVKFGYRKDFKKSALEFAVDLQNVSNYQNVFQRGYNQENKSVSVEYQQGFFPVPMIRYTF